jgi:hypothetical protein
MVDESKQDEQGRQARQAATCYRAAEAGADYQSMVDSRWCGSS